MGGAGSGERSAWEAASLVFRIATVGLSLASAVMTAASKQCLYRGDGSPAGSVSYIDYGSFKYSALANLLSATLQGVAIYLEVVGKEKWAKTVDLIDKLVLALTSTSAPLLFAADNITSCGPPRGGRSRGTRGQPKRFDEKLQRVACVDLGPLVLTTANEVVKKLKRHKKLKSTPDVVIFVPVALPDLTVPPPPPPPPPPVCSCSCPTSTMPCCRENHDPCSASTS